MAGYIKITKVGKGGGDYEYSYRSDGATIEFTGPMQFVASGLNGRREAISQEIFASTSARILAQRIRLEPMSGRLGRAKRYVLRFQSVSEYFESETDLTRAGFDENSFAVNLKPSPSGPGEGYTALVDSRGTIKEQLFGM